MAKKTAIYDGIFIVLLTGICHFLFSKYGFNPTDEGFVLSATNRVLHGQIPHLDFSSVRPLGYAYLHIPELLFSKNYAFLISRFVFWMEQILIAYFWIRFIINYSKIEISLVNKYALIIVCFIFNVHYFPASVLHTIDGLLFCTMGLNFVISEKKYAFFGFFFIGFAVLCKQNYAVILPFSIFLFGRKNIAGNLISGVFPVLFYVGLISYFGGLNDITTQLTGHNELWLVGFHNYLFNYYFLIGIFVAYLFKKWNLHTTIYLFTLGTILIASLITNHYHGKISFLFFGALIAELLDNAVKNNFRKIIAQAIILAWCVSISVGYNTPALFLGGIFSLIILKNIYNNSPVKNTITIAFIITLSSVFSYVRFNNIYRDTKANECLYKLDNIVEGAYGIKTNRTTFKVLVELELLKKKFPNIIVVPDFTASNILHAYQSRILTEWPNKTEIPNDKILEKIISKIIYDSSLIFVIPKYQTALLKDSLSEYPNSGSDYPIIRFVKDSYQKTEDYSYFEIYKK